MANNYNRKLENGEASTKKLIASSAMCHCCFDTLIDALQHPGSSKNKIKANPDFLKDLPDPAVQCPLFVTWEKCSRKDSAWRLRGCIGCLSPRPLATDVAEYALISALNDRRFNPITLEEVQSLRVSVSLLVDYERCKNVYDWTIGVHGILIKFAVNGQRFDGTFLPEVAKEQHWDHKTTVASLIQKAGYYGVITQQLLDGIQCTRYQSSKHKITYGEYIDVKCIGVDPIGNPLEGRKPPNRSGSPCKNM